MEGRESRMNRRASDADFSARYYELSAARVGIPPLPA
jgi:hypothetical protein